MHASIDAGATPIVFSRADEHARAEAGVHEHATLARLDEHRVPTAPAAEHPDLHSFTVHRCSNATLELRAHAVLQRDVAARHHALGRLEELIDADTTRTSPPRPTRRARPPWAASVLPNTFAPAPSTHPVVRRHADAGLGVIAEQRAEELHPRVARAVRCPELHRAVRVLQVARDRARAEVDPAPEHRMADEAVVPLVGVAEEDRVAQLPVHLARVADRRRGDPVGGEDAVLADVERSDQPRERLHVRAGAEQDRAPRSCRSTRSARRRRRARRTPDASRRRSRPSARPRRCPAASSGMSALEHRRRGGGCSPTRRPSTSRRSRVRAARASRARSSVAVPSPTSRVRRRRTRRTATTRPSASSTSPRAAGASEGANRAFTSQLPARHARPLEHGRRARSPRSPRDAAT